MSLTLIAAVASNRAIGKDNRLLWHLSDDFKHFKKTTMGHPIVMGRKTFESLPQLLPGRVHYVLSSNPAYEVPEGVKLFHDVKDLLAALPDGENFVIGGAHIYSLLMPYADKMVLTELDKSYEGDAFFPEFDRNEWKVTEKIKGEDETIPHLFVTYERVHS